MKRFLLIVIFVLATAVVSFAQTQYISFQGRQVAVGSTEYKALCNIYGEEVVNSKQPYTLAPNVYIPVFSNEYAFQKYMTGQRMIASGVTTTLLASCVAVGCSFIPDPTPKNVTLAVTGVIGAVGGIVSLVGLYKSRKWRFDGGGFTYSF